MNSSLGRQNGVRTYLDATCIQQLCRLSMTLYRVLFTLVSTERPKNPCNQYAIFLQNLLEIRWGFYFLFWASWALPQGSVRGCMAPQTSVAPGWSLVGEQGTCCRPQHSHLTNSPLVLGSEHLPGVLLPSC